MSIYFLSCSDLWGLTGYHDAAEARRGDVIEGLSLREQKSLGVASFSPGGAKRRRMAAELTEEGVMELCVKYERYLMKCNWCVWFIVSIQTRLSSTHTQVRAIRALQTTTPRPSLL